MARLARPLPMMVSAEEVCVLNTPSQADISYSLDVMKDWCQMAVHIVQSELPLFEISQAFSILDLNHDNPKDIRHANQNCNWDTKLKTLCDLFTDKTNVQPNRHQILKD